MCSYWNLIFCWDSFSAGFLACNGPIWQHGPLEYTGFQHIASYCLVFGVLWTYAFMTPIPPFHRQTQTNVDNSGGSGKPY